PPARAPTPIHTLSLHDALPISGNMDSMINRYTADHKIRRDDAYTPGNVGGKRPDRAVTVYAQRCREAFKGVPVIIGGIEASLRRDRKSTRLNSSHVKISYAVFC